MVRVMLVDDEAAMRVSLRGMLDWERHGFYICAEARNGREAIGSIESARPDIVITDISMPIVNGIDLIDYITGLNRNIATITLSSFDDFNYVRGSLKSGAQDYLLKHQLTPELLLKTLAAAVRLRPRPDVPEAPEMNRDTALHSFLMMLLSECFDNPEIVREQLKKLRLEALERPMAVVLAEPDPLSDGGEVHSLHAMLGILRESAPREDHVLISIIGKDRLLILVPVDPFVSAAKQRDACHRMLLRMRGNLLRFLDVRVSFAISGVSQGVLQLRSHYEQAWALMREARFDGKAEFIAEPAGTVRGGAPITLDPAREKALNAAMRDGDAATAARVIHETFDAFIGAGFTGQDLQMVYMALMNSAIRWIRELSMREDQFFQRRAVGIKSPHEFRNLMEMSVWFDGVFTELCAMLADRRAQFSYNDHTRKAIAYIRENFERQISLRDVARHLNINSAYLSRLFKADTGGNVVSYINRVRIERAVRLLEEGELTLKQVAHSVGFSSYNHFFTLFKAMRGIAPNKYKAHEHRVQT